MGQLWDVHVTGWIGGVVLFTWNGEKAFGYAGLFVSGSAMEIRHCRQLFFLLGCRGRRSVWDV